jgi:hypothetical protein
LSGGVYAPVIPAADITYSPVMAPSDNIQAGLVRSASMDLVYLALGGALFALFGVYAVLLRRV